MSIKHKGYTYELFIRLWLKGDKKYEAIKWETGYRNLWERIPYEEYLQVKTIKDERVKN